MLITCLRCKSPVFVSSQTVAGGEALVACGACGAGLAVNAAGAMRLAHDDNAADVVAPAAEIAHSPPAVVAPEPEPVPVPVPALEPEASGSAVNPNHEAAPPAHYSLPEFDGVASPEVGDFAHAETPPAVPPWAPAAETLAPPAPPEPPIPLPPMPAAPLTVEPPAPAMMELGAVDQSMPADFPGEPVGLPPQPYAQSTAAVLESPEPWSVLPLSSPLQAPPAAELPSHEVVHEAPMLPEAAWMQAAVPHVPAESATPAPSLAFESPLPPEFQGVAPMPNEPPRVEYIPESVHSSVPLPSGAYEDSGHAALESTAAAPAIPYEQPADVIALPQAAAESPAPRLPPEFLTSMPPVVEVGGGNWVGGHRAPMDENWHVAAAQVASSVAAPSTGLEQVVQSTAPPDRPMAHAAGQNLAMPAVPEQSWHESPMVDLSRLSAAGFELSTAEHEPMDGDDSTPNKRSWGVWGAAALAIAAALGAGVFMLGPRLAADRAQKAGEHTALQQARKPSQHDVAHAKGTANEPLERPQDAGEEVKANAALDLNAAEDDEPRVVNDAGLQEAESDVGKGRRRRPGRPAKNLVKGRNQPPDSDSAGRNSPESAPLAAGKKRRPAEAAPAQLPPPVDHAPAAPAAPKSPSNAEQAAQHYRQGNLYLRERKVTLAIDELTECLRLKPGFGMAYRSLGGAYMLLGRERSAIDAYRKFVELEPKHQDVARVRQIIADYDRRR